MNDRDHVLEVEKLCVDYLDTPLFGKKTSFRALEDISFYVNRGEILGLVGESGCGKSTLSKALLGILDRATVTGEIRHFSQRPQMVFRDPFGSLNPSKTVGSSRSPCGSAGSARLKSGRTGSWRSWSRWG